MRATALACVVLAAITSFAQDNFFPKGTLSDIDRVDKMKARWFRNQLKGLDEPSLLEETKNSSLESYRFLWLRTFHHPVAVRLDIMADGSGTLTIKMASGAGGYEPGNLIENTSHSIERRKIEKFLGQVKSVGFWDLPSYETTLGCDGSEWIIEGVKDGKYHVAERWTPDKGPVHQLGITLAMTLANLKIPESELY
jgi:hypothetical protein